jgi:beta-galactosidase
MTTPRTAMLVGALALLLQPAAPAADVPWEDPAVFERGQVPGRATLMPFGSVGEALANDRKASASCLLLRGTWKFDWAPVPEAAPARFFEPGFDASGWADIEVPGSWQMQGFGHAKFRNIQHPFPADPPRVPKDDNPVGSYRRTFVLPEGWRDRQVFLHFEGVKSASTVWVNGREVGYNEGGMEPAEYDVTAHVRPGENTIAVRVLRWSDGSYLEAQDMWRLSGIHRDVYLMATPRVHVRDFFVTTDLDAAYRAAELRIEAEVENHLGEPVSGHRIRATLHDTGGAPVQAHFESDAVAVPAAGTTTVRLAAPVAAPRLWSAEKPHLYRLVLELLSPDGEVIEILGARVGFRKVEVRGQAFLVNGRPVKLNAMNSHVHHPDTGRAMDVATMRADLVLMKRFGVNAVRTSHYPPNVEYLDLADELGVYVIDEAGTEAHATEFLSERPEWREAYVDRGRKMVLRDRNHPSVVLWSAGNESGSGENICAVIAEGKRLDPSRPAWMYGGNNDYFPGNDPLDCEDVVGPRYPIPFELETRIARVRESVDPRPSFMDEYAAATGNSLGGLDEYWEVIRAHPRTIGGAVWDWVSPGIRATWRETPDGSPHGNHGALMGRAALVPGRSGQAVALSGHDEWVEVYREASLDVTGDQLTLEAWVLPRRWNGTGTFLTKGSHQFALQQTGETTLELSVHAGKRATVVAPTPIGWEGSWHHLAGVYDGKELRLFVDGRVVGRTAHSGAIEDTPFPVNIGRNAALHGQEHPGQLSNAVIDAVRIYARALGEDELGRDTPALRREARLWLDFETVEEKGPFWSLGIGGRSYGVVWPDRTVQPELWQLKKSAQPVGVEGVDLAAGRIRVTNRHQFTDLSELETRWRLTADDRLVEEGRLDLAVPPGESALVDVPFRTPRPEPGVEHRLDVSLVLPKATAWAAAGHEVAWEQLDFPRAPVPAAASVLAPPPPLQMERSGGRVVVRGRGFDGTFDEKTGTLVSLRFGGTELLAEGPRANVWRAPLANERDAWGVYRGRLATHREGMGDDVANGWRAIGLDRLEHTVTRFSARQVSEGEVVVEVRALATSPVVSSLAFASGFELEYLYRVLGTGEIVLRHRVVPHGRMPQWLPKVGLQMALAEGMETLTWYGRGPYETYPDRKTGARVGLYEESVEDQDVPYIVPQDHGNKTDVRWAALRRADGVGLLVSGDELLNVSAQRYSTDNLSRASYRPQLVPTRTVTLNLDHRVSGVGGTAVSVLTAYQTPPQPYTFTVRLRPFRGEPRELSRQGVP